LAVNLEKLKHIANVSKLSFIEMLGASCVRRVRGESRHSISGCNLCLPFSVQNEDTSSQRGSAVHWNVGIGLTAIPTLNERATANSATPVNH